MKEEPAPDNDVEAPHRSPSPSAPELADVVETPVPPRRRRKRRAVWPILLSVVLAGSAWTIAEAATLPPLPAVDANADAAEADSADDAGAIAVLPVAAPSPGPSAVAAPFGPQIQVILPPPPPPPPAASGTKRSSAERKAAAQGAAASGMSTTAYCDAKYGATTSASDPRGLLAAANSERAIFGLAPLSWSDSLASLAQQWSDAMAGAASISNPGALFYHDMVPSPGGQNIAYYGGSPAPSQATAISKAHTGWMASPGHCKNILRASFTSMGAAIAVTSDGAVWYSTVDFQ